CDAAIERLRGERASKHERCGELAGAIDAARARWAAALPPDEARALDRGRDALARLVAAWRGHADAIAAREAALGHALVEVDRGARGLERALAEHVARCAGAERRRDELVAEHAEATARLDAARAAAGFELAELRRLLAAEPGRADALAEQLAAIDRAADRARTRLAERRRLVDDHAAARPAPDELGDAARLPALADAVAAAERHAAALAAALAADDEARARRADALAELANLERGAEIDRVLGQVIGSHDGKLFRSFAQSLTLDGLLAVANAHLEELAPRYQLERVPRHDLELQVIDRDLGGDVRSVQSLSGGESFLVSLALALGLSSMSAHDVRVRTLLIDEGFGTLDPATLDSALAVLDALQATGRQVGVISHVPALLERVGAHVVVTPRGGGRSEVVVGQA
ncbi:MAG TPA: SbcC/MukB-like Walker B domain-containing protein, partial [Kofleriaceae bacterium]|nr:SbcC/MukB-like Walker B domain-containing protein [Kofleriaceae bacterium]